MKLCGKYGTYPTPSSRTSVNGQGEKVGGEGTGRRGDAIALPSNKASSMACTTLSQRRSANRDMSSEEEIEVAAAMDWFTAITL